jgi:hypothetical protein
MVAGQYPKGYPLDLTPPHSVDKVDRMTQAVYGHDCKFHDITGLPLQQGIGHLDHDLQALADHLPIIAKRHGVAVAKEMKERIERRTKNVR